jgi:hypothetical protein
MPSMRESQLDWWSTPAAASPTPIPFRSRYMRRVEATRRVGTVGLTRRVVMRPIICRIGTMVNQDTSNRNLARLACSGLLSLVSDVTLLIRKVTECG